MRKSIIGKISLFILFSIATVGMLAYSDVYNDVQSNIVSKQCLSCIKLDPISQIEFTFKTANSQSHPDFILDNLTIGPIFIFYSKDACPGCDIMKPVVDDLFGVDFHKDEFFYKTVNFEGSNINFLHINIQHSTKNMSDSFYVYDKKHENGLPMFVVISLGDNDDYIEPYYTTVYGTLALDNDVSRKAFLRDMMLAGLRYYDENYMEYSP